MVCCILYIRSISFETEVQTGIVLECYATSDTITLPHDHNIGSHESKDSEFLLELRRVPDFFAIPGFQTFSSVGTGVDLSNLLTPDRFSGVTHSFCFLRSLAGGGRSSAPLSPICVPSWLAVNSPDFLPGNLTVGSQTSVRLPCFATSLRTPKFDGGFTIPFCE